MRRILIYTGAGLLLLLLLLAGGLWIFRKNMIFLVEKLLPL